MKGRKNKSALISSSSRSVWPMHIQKARWTLFVPPRARTYLPLCRAPSGNVNSTRHPRFSCLVPPAASYHNRLYTYLRPPPANF